MKRLVSVLLLSLCLILTVGAQSFPSSQGQYSLEYYLTSGLFANEIDRSFSFGPGFGTDKNALIFSGISGNPQWLGNVDSTTSYFSGGYYQPGTIPFSAFTQFNATSLATALSADSVTSTYLTKPVTSGTTTTTHEYQGTQSTTTYSQPSSLSSLNLSLQGILKLGPVTTGLSYNQANDWSATNGDSAYYSTTTLITYYDSNYASATTAPSAATDYTTTTTIKNINPASLAAAGAAVTTLPTGLNSTTSTSTFYIPFAFATGSITHQGYANLVLSNTDASGSYSITETAHTYAAAATVTDRDITVTDKDSNVTLSGLYLATLPGFLFKDKGGTFTAGLALSDKIKSSTYDYADTDKVYNTATLTSKSATSGYSTVAQATYNNGNYLDVAATFNHLLPLVKNTELSFSMKPTLILDFNTDSDPSLASRTYYTQGLNASFAYDAGTYTKTSIAYSTTAATTSVFGLKLSLPTAFKIRPTGWVFGIYASATPTLNLKWTTTTSAYGTTTTTTDTITAGTTTATTVTSSTTSKTSTEKFAPTVAEDHRFGVFVPFGSKEQYRMDIYLAGNNITAFEDFTVQLIVPLE